MKLNYFNFRMIKDKVLLTNDLGKHVFVEPGEFKNLVARKIDLNSDTGKELIESGMVYEGSGLHFTESKIQDLKNNKGHLISATSLHIFVVTTACNLNCVYCQANNGTVVPNCFMDEETAEKAVDIALQSPETNLSFEFQGGEPLLNFAIVKHIVEHTERCNTFHKIEYNIVTNLTLITDEILEFFVQHRFGVSTSLDGGQIVHDTNRPYRDGSGTYEKVVESINRLRDHGIAPGAIETTTRLSLSHAKNIVDTYASLGFGSIFIRHLTQLGKANKRWENIGYSADEFMHFYIEALDRLIQYNIDGRCIKEQHASIFLKRINGKQMNYMELRSPCGGGIGQLAYFADGRVFSCDEGRMLAEMGDDAFQLGNVYDDTYETLIDNGVCRTICSSSTLETIPSCCDCAYQPYCGTCPVLNYALDKDVIEKQPGSFRCNVYKGILDHLFELILDGNCEIQKVLNDWSE